jgi:hypothetical protein
MHHTSNGTLPSTDSTLTFDAVLLQAASKAKAAYSAERKGASDGETQSWPL